MPKLLFFLALLALSARASAQGQRFILHVELSAFGQKDKFGPTDMRLCGAIIYNFQHVHIGQLTDTLELRHPFLQIPKARLIDFPHALRYDTLFVQAPATPQTQTSYQLQIFSSGPLSKPDTLKLQLLADTDKLKPLNFYSPQHKKRWQIKPQRTNYPPTPATQNKFAYTANIIYGQQENGYFLLPNNDTLRLDPFDFYHPIYLQSNTITPQHPKNIENTRAYLLAQINQKIYLRALLQQHEIQQNELQSQQLNREFKIFDLQNQLADCQDSLLRCKNLPVPDRPQPIIPPPPPPQPWPEPVPVYAPVFYPASPRHYDDMPDYLAELKKITPQDSPKGNIILRTEVTLDGFAQVEIIYCQKAQIHTANKLVKHIEATRWQPAKISGFALNSSFLLYVDIR